VEPKVKLLDQMRLVLRLKHRSHRTEETYVLWARRFILFHHKRHPKDMGAQEIRNSFGPGAWLDLLPDGRFDASPEGMRYLGYTEPGTLKAYRAEELQREFYDPEAVRAVLAQYVGQSPQEHQA
jgi:hypothetical protein